MKSKKQDDGTIEIRFNKDEALVLFEWLSRFNNLSNEEVFEEDSEQKILNDLESSFEETLTEPFMPNYIELLEKARDNIKGVD